MNEEIGLSISFRWNRIRFRNALIESIGNPEYIHLLINSTDRMLYIQACQRDKDAFKVYFQNDPSDAAFYLRGKRLMQYIARLIGVDEDASVRYLGTQVDERTVVIALKEFEEIAREQE